MLFSQQHELLYGQAFAAFGVINSVVSFLNNDGSLDLHFRIFLSWGLSCLCFYIMISRYQQREDELSQENWNLRQEINDLKNKKPPCGGP